MRQLDSLFDKWKQDTYADELLKGRPFIKDGIIDDITYSEQDAKALFISNESNIDGYFDLNTDYDVRTDFCDYANNRHDYWQGKLRERVSSLYQVILNDYSKPTYEYAKSFAFINLNKTGGGSEVNPKS